MNVFDFYRDIWNEFNWLGKVTLFPIMLLCFPFFWFMYICFKKET
jgi:hypothetical protein